MRVRCHIAAVLPLLLLSGCSTDSQTPKHRAIPAAFENLPIVFTAKQRATTLVPCSNGRVLITTSDLTGGRIEISLANIDGESLLSPRSMREGDGALFLVNGLRYRVSTRRLVNHLIGDDHAEFEISAVATHTSDETAKIESFLGKLAAMSDVRFVRNRQTYTSMDAADHLRRKWASRRDEVTSLAEFIEKIASRSSLSGEAYYVELPDQTSVPAAEFFRTRGLDHDGK